MAIKHFSYDYNMFEASVSFRVDTDVFTVEQAKETLEFFGWSYNRAGDLIHEVMKKYAIKAIEIATFNNYNESGVISEFENIEGFYKLDGSAGIWLQTVQEYEFDENYLSETITTE